MATAHTNIVPEVLFYNVLKGILTYIREDIVAQATPQETILYSIFQDIGLEKHHYLSEAISLFGRTEEMARSVDVRLFFDSARAQEPTVHVTLASDELGPTNSIGLGQDEEVYQNELNTEYAEVFSRSFNTSLSIVCTSSNHHEVLIMYYVIRNCLIAILDSLELSGFQNVQLSGRDLQIREDLVPNHVFSRAVMLRGFYETRVRNFSTTQKINSILFENIKLYKN